MKYPVGEVLKSYFRLLGKTMFLVGGGLAFALAFGSLLNNESMLTLKNSIAEPLQIVVSALIGFVAPGPRYIIYPLLAKLFEMGLSLSVIYALVVGHVLIEPSTAMLESGFFGWRFPLKRFAVSLVITLAAAELMLLLDYMDWGF